jgi:hypothetical protein
MPCAPPPPAARSPAAPPSSSSSSSPSPPPPPSARSAAASSYASSAASGATFAAPPVATPMAAAGSWRRAATRRASRRASRSSRMVESSAASRGVPAPWASATASPAVPGKSTLVALPDSCAGGPSFGERPRGMGRSGDGRSGPNARKGPRRTESALRRDPTLHLWFASASASEHTKRKTSEPNPIAHPGYSVTPQNMIALCGQRSLRRPKNKAAPSALTSAAAAMARSLTYAAWPRARRPPACGRL